MDAPARESPSEAVSHFSSERPLNNWTNEETGDEGTGGETFGEDDPALQEMYGEFDASDWNDSDGDLVAWGGDGGKKSYAETARMFKLRRNLDQLDCFHRQKEHNVLKAREELRVCRLNIDELERQRDAVEVEIDIQKKKENSAAVLRLRAQHKCVCQELQTEEELEAHVHAALREHELELCQVEVELGRFSLLRQEVEEEEQAHQELQAQRGAARRQQEEATARGRQRHARRLQAKQAAMRKDEEARCQRSTEAARTGRKKAAVFLKETVNRMHQREAEKEQQSSELLRKRMRAVQSLKTNIAATQESLRAQQNRARADARTHEQEEVRLMEELRARGFDGVKHAYQQKRLQEFQRKKEEFEEKQKSGTIEIVAKLLLEEDLWERRKPPGPVNAKKASGRGTSRAKVLRILQPPLAEAKEGRIRRESALSDSSSSSEHSDLDDLRETRGPEEEQGLTESLAQPEFTGLWNQTHQSSPGEETLAKSFQSRAARLDVPLLPVGKLTVPPKKGTHGKEFKGPPYISKPEVILFKDFEVGKTYKKKIILTNVSYATNYCKLLGVTEDLRDFISMSLDPPGSMSSGMACDMQATFQPMINKDLEGEVRFLSAAGPFSVPIRCTVKKCDLAVDSRLIDFGTHVVGQTISRSISLTNRGALGTHFTLVPSACPSPAQTQALARACSNATQQESSSAEAASDGQDSSALQPSGELKSERDSRDSSVTSEQKRSGAQIPAVDEAAGPEAGPGRGPSRLETGPAPEACVEELSSDPSDFAVGEVRDGEVGPFESVKLQIVFTPTIPGEAKLDFHIKFSDPSCEPIPVGVRGTAVCVPVWVAQPSIDLKICMFDRLYQDSIVVQSRASTALRLTFEVCPELRNHMEILPKTGYIQARSTFNAQLKFLPRRSLSEDAKGFFDSETSVLEVPLRVIVADQVRPVSFSLHAVVTSTDLQFDQTEVDFGHCSIYESVRTSVRLTNLSLLPQDFGFLGIPQFMDVQPNDGFGTLLPLETLSIDLIFSAKRAGEFSFQLVCKSGINRDFPIQCRALGVHPPLELSHSVVHFGATAVGDSCTTALHVVNSHTSRNEFSHPVPRVGKGPVAPVGPRMFAFAPPEDSEVSIAPMAGRVLPGQRCLVQVTFRPRLGDQEVREEAVGVLRRAEELRLQEPEGPLVAEAEGVERTEQERPSKRAPPVDPKKGKKQPSASSQGKPALKEKSSKVSVSPKTDSPFRPPRPADIQPGSEDYAAGEAALLRSFSERCRRYVIPCFVSDVDPPHGDPPNGDPGAEPAYSSLSTLYLELHCLAVRPPLVVTSCNGQTTIDFGQVAVGQKVVKMISVQNVSNESLELGSSVLDLSGPFSVLNALRPLEPGDTHTLLMAFAPALGKKYQETLEVCCPKMTLTVTLRGVGVDPVITCSLQGGLIDFGYVLEKETAAQTFKLRNASSLAVGFSVLLDSLSPRTPRGGADSLPVLLCPGREGQTRPTVGTQNLSGLSVFSVTPVEGAIAPGKSQDITVAFLPDHESLHYSDRLRVELKNKSTVVAVELKGAARCHTMFLCGGDPLDVSTQTLLPPPALGTPEHTVDSEKPPLPVLLTLRAVYREGTMSPAVRQLEVGCIRSTQPGAKKNVEFCWDDLAVLQQRGISVEPSKGTVDAGHRRTITVTWTPPSGLKPNEVVQVCAPLTLRGEETEVYSVTLLALASTANH